jgi:hypothetical protein
MSSQNPNADRSVDPEHDPQAAEPSQQRPAKRFAWSNMFVHPDEDPHSEGGHADFLRERIDGRVRQ